MQGEPAQGIDWIKALSLAVGAAGLAFGVVQWRENQRAQRLVFSLEFAPALAAEFTAYTETFAEAEAVLRETSADDPAGVATQQRLAVAATGVVNRLAQLDYCRRTVGLCDDVFLCSVLGDHLRGFVLRLDGIERALRRDGGYDSQIDAALRSARAEVAACNALAGRS